MAVVLGTRQAAVVRELTKKFEQTVRGTFDELSDHYRANGWPKGEIVIVVAPAEQKIPGREEIDALLKRALTTMSVKDAAAFVAGQTGESKNRFIKQH